MIKCIAMDDEPLALSQLKAYISRVPFLRLSAACPDTYSAMQALDDTHADAIFADINMPDLNGLEFIRSLSMPPLVVFTTAYSDYAIEGYKVNAIDYLLKPFSFDEFLRAANKLRQRHELTLQAAQAQAPTATPSFLYIKSARSMSRLDTATILYIEGMGEYVRIHIVGSPKPLTALLSMRKIESQLPQDTFLRVHKSYIANMAQATRVTHASISFGSGHTIPIGDACRSDVLAYIDNHSLK